MISHDTYRTGDQWLQCENEDYQRRGYCQVAECENATSSLDHILTNCSLKSQKQIWAYAEEIWNRAKPPFEWERPNIGTIVACAQMCPPARTERINRGKYRLYRIIMMESAYLIWKLRWERTFSREDEETEQEVSNRWHATINERLRLDIALTHPRWKNKAIPAKKVINTWKNTLENEEYLTKDWTKPGRGF